jgi:hypothetical protein
MSHYSDPQHALLARIAKALERIADSLEQEEEKNPLLNPTKNEEN